MKTEKKTLELMLKTDFPGSVAIEDGEEEEEHSPDLDDLSFRRDVLSCIMQPVQWIAEEWCRSK